MRNVKGSQRQCAAWEPLFGHSYFKASSQTHRPSRYPSLYYPQKAERLRCFFWAWTSEHKQVLQHWLRTCFCWTLEGLISGHPSCDMHMGYDLAEILLILYRVSHQHAHDRAWLCSLLEPLQSHASASISWVRGISTRGQRLPQSKLKDAYAVTVKEVYEQSLKRKWSFFHWISCSAVIFSPCLTVWWNVSLHEQS